MPRTILRQWLVSGAAAGALLMAAPSFAQESQPTYSFDLASKPMTEAVQDVGRQTGVNILVDPSLVAGRRAPALQGEMTTEVALGQLLSGTNLEVRQTAANTLLIRKVDQDPQGGSAGGVSAVDALVVTAQKREEAIQDVPIAISAFSQESLDQQKIEGGFDLLKAIPNVTFSKNNFTSYNFSIRGIGTKAISATTDPGVAVAFNYSGLIQNRLFEQEYFDVERVEVLRGPQGTLYGRNATGGVINVISATPELDNFFGSIKGEVGNYGSTRLVGVANLPLVEDVLGVRFAGSLTRRDGYGFNDATGNDVDGRDLWSTRVTVGFEPSERLRANLIWEHFEEDDNRARTSKQLCHKDEGPEFVGSTPLDTISRRALFSTGCKPGSLYDQAAFDTPFGVALPFVFGVSALASFGYTLGWNANGEAVTVLDWMDPYGGIKQSDDLRRISSLKDPRYRAKADIFELNIDFELTDTLTLSSQTLFNKDEVYSTQDYNRFNTYPIFADSSQWFQSDLVTPSEYAELTPGGYYCDPQLGCSNTIVGQDISQATAEQFGQEFRLTSDFDGPVNFSAGVNYTTFDVLADYYVMYNLMTLLSRLPPLGFGANYLNCPIDLEANLVDPPISMESPEADFCVYVDPNPLESINGEGHNYYRSKNPYELESSAIFGEVYWQASDDLKITAGLRYTDDRKTFTPVPSQLLLSRSFVSGGYVSRGYPAEPDIKQRWREFTGRVGVDWKPALSFTDETMLYAFYSRGYKGGGANPPSIGFATPEDCDTIMPSFAHALCGEGQMLPSLTLTAVNYPRTFRPEFVDAIEIGAKNTLLQGAMMLNITAFYYDYKDYQVSKIVDRTAVNENFDAKVWGIEFETLFTPTRNLAINANLGLMDSQIGNDARSIDIMDRTQGNPGWVTTKPWFQLPSNCIVPVPIAEQYLAWINGFAAGENVAGQYDRLCGGWNLNQSNIAIDPDYDAANSPNGGAGFFADLGGNDLPNSPHWTFNIGAQYGFDLLTDWRATVRADYYRQGDSYARVYNTEYDKLRGWDNANIRLTLERPDDGLMIEAYVKNVFDNDPVTDAFLNSDDSGLTTNVFVLDPRLIGLSVRKEF